MAMKPYRQAVAVTGTYTDRQGAEKKRYVNVGTLFQYDDGGFALKLDTVPVGQGWNGFVSFYEFKEKAATSDTAKGDDGFEDRDIPF
jgi:hypothetical protein